VDLDLLVAQNTGGAGIDTLSGIEGVIGSSFNDVLAGNSGANTLLGERGHDSLRGGAGNDSLFGDTGRDTLSGGLGNDTLNGGSRADLFRFDTALNASTNVDRINGYSIAEDTIQLDDDIFTAAGAVGTLSASAFRAGASAQDADDRIIYDSATGSIYYDADGSGAGAQMLFATVTAGLALTRADFSIIG
jgi:serralysin